MRAARSRSACQQARRRRQSARASASRARSGARTAPRGSPRTRSSASGSAAVPAPVLLFVAPKEAHEWRLVTVRGRIETMRKLGDRWRAELVVGRDRVVVVGQSGAGIPVASVQTGHLATVTGIVRRPYPSATDRRFGILPRAKADLRVDPGSSMGSGSKSAAGAGATGPWLGLGQFPGLGSAGPRGPCLGSRCESRRPLGASPAAPSASAALSASLCPAASRSTTARRSAPIVLEGAAADLLAAHRAR